MAVMMKKDGYQTLLSLGVSQAALDLMKGANMKVVVMANAIKIAHHGEVVAAIPVTIAALEAIAQNGATAPSHKLLVQAAGKAAGIALSKAGLQNAGLAETPVLSIEPAAPSAWATLQKQNEQAKAAKAAPKHTAAETTYTAPMAAPISKDDFPIDQMESAPTVKLINATKLYQPVIGGSGNSRYFVVGMRVDLRVGARFLAGKLSIRCEGPAVSANSDIFSGVGLEHKGGYYSMHLPGLDEITARKALGAVLGGLGMHFDTPMPDLGRIAGKGS